MIDGPNMMADFVPIPKLPASGNDSRDSRALAKRFVPDSSRGEIKQDQP
jgi:hypothetical protein